MKSIIIGLIGDLLLAVSAIAGEQPRNAWFSALDRNGDGGISLGELQIVRYERFAILDINRDQEISLKEVSESRSWTQRLHRMDHNSDGRVTIREYENNGRGRFSVIDINGDGRITPHEALNFERKVRKYSPPRNKTS